MPGHEIVGRVSTVGTHVSRFKPGGLVGIGCIVDSCKQCDDCAEGQLLRPHGRHLQRSHGGCAGHALGGYSQRIVVHERYVLRVATPNHNWPPFAAAVRGRPPGRRCATGAGRQKGGRGRHWRAGHVGIELAHALGARVVAFTTSDSKRQAALALGAEWVVVSRNRAEMKAHAKSFDFILNTVAAPHDLDAFGATAPRRRDGAGRCPATPHPSPDVST